MVAKRACAHYQSLCSLISSFWSSLISLALTWLPSVMLKELSASHKGAEGMTGYDRAWNQDVLSVQEGVSTDG